MHSSTTVNSLPAETVQNSSLAPPENEPAAEDAENPPASGTASADPVVPVGIVFQDVLESLPAGVAVLDSQRRIRWCNLGFRALAREEAVVGRSLQEVFPGAEFEDFSREFFASPELHTGKVRGTFRRDERTIYEFALTPIGGRDRSSGDLVMTVRDISAEVHQQQKLSAIYAAGIELGEISAEDLRDLSVAERIELLKQKIIQFTKDVLEFETIEIRLLDKTTRVLEPLLNVGMTPEAAARKLVAEPTGNGVTGFVAAGGGSYLCGDAAQDPRYLPGAPNARSSLTVPLMLHDEILGTFNVESDRINAFTRQDLEFLELFGREVALAINTLELLAVEKVTAATQYTGMILREVARPVDEILNNTSWILDRYIGHDPSVCERLQKVQKQTRDIKTLIQKVGAALTPAATHSTAQPQRLHPRLRSKRILVVDNDEAVRDQAHAALGQIGCEVETAHNGEEALLMARTFHYDVVIVDIRLPDMSGYECFVALRNINEHLPVILMTGFGYDPGHSIVKARQAGLKSALYKPFRLDQLLTELERAITVPAEPPRQQ
jgi:CheY-like chemotaxis protein